MKKTIFLFNFQSSSHDLEACRWSNVPEEDFVLQDDYEWVIGEFVWTGFDYLGEPTPYNEAWPSHSSYFGICDLAGIPKDRYYLYRSRWNTKDQTSMVKSFPNNLSRFIGRRMTKRELYESPLK